MRKNFEPLRSQCPVAVTLDVLGDKWTLIIVRDMLVGKSRFSEFLASPEGIKKNILTERLKRLQALGVVRKEEYQQRPVRYRYLLTESGVELLPIIQEMARWANAHVENLWQPSTEFFERTPASYLDAATKQKAD